MIKLRINLTKQQTNILTIAAVVAASMFIFFVFIYTPKQTQIRRLKQQLSGIEASLNKIEAVVGSRKDLGSGILKLRQEALDLDSRFLKPDDTAALLEMLSEKAREFEIEVVSTRPSEFRIWYDKRGKTLELENAQCYEIDIDMDVTGTYAALADYMQSLTANESPRLVIGKFSIEKSQNTAVLRASMVVEAFALLPKKEGRE